MRIFHSTDKPKFLLAVCNFFPSFPSFVECFYLLPSVSFVFVFLFSLPHRSINFHSHFDFHFHMHIRQTPFKFHMLPIETLLLSNLCGGGGPDTLLTWQERARVKSTKKKEKEKKYLTRLCSGPGLPNTTRPNPKKKKTGNRVYEQQYTWQIRHVAWKNEGVKAPFLPTE